MFFLKSKRHLADKVRFSWAGLLAAVFLTVAPAVAGDDIPEASVFPKFPPADSEEVADLLDDAFRLLADGKEEAAQQQVDVVRVRRRERLGTSEEARRNCEVWLSDFEELRRRPPSDIAKYLAARQQVYGMLGRLNQMQARMFPHAMTLAVVEDSLQTCMPVFRRALGGESLESVRCCVWLGHVHGCRRDWQAAEESYERALELLETHFSRDRSAIAATRQWLAWTLMLQNKDFPRQKEYLESVIAYAESRTDEEARYWPQRAKTLLAEAAYRNGSRKEADRLFAELREQLPEEGEEGDQDPYAQWCCEWCYRHRARMLIAEKEYREALAATVAARKAFCDGGQKAELSGGLTSQETYCLAAAAVNKLTPESVAQMEMAAPYPPQSQLSIANAIAKHAASLRGLPYEPLGLLAEDSDSLGSAESFPVKVVSTRHQEGMIIRVKGASRKDCKTLPPRSLEDAIASIVESSSSADTNINVETCLRLGEFDKVRQWAGQLRDQAERMSGRDHVTVKAASEVLHVMDVIDGLSEEDQQAFSYAFSLLQEARHLLNQAEQHVFCSFERISDAMDRLRLASDRLAAFPEPLNQFTLNCELHLSEAHMLLRNWHEAELILSRICEREGDSMLFACPFMARCEVSYALLQQGKGRQRIEELLNAQTSLICATYCYSFCRIRPEPIFLRKAQAAAAFDDRDEADLAYQRLRSFFAEDELCGKHWLAFCDRHRARRLLEDDDPVGACELIEDAYAKMIVHGKGSYCHGPEIEKTLRLRAEIYERLGRSDEAKADIAYADDIVCHTERVRGMCAADAEQRGKWANAKVNIPSLSTEDSDDQECAKKETTGLEEWLRTGTGEYATGQSLFSKRR